MSFDGLRDAALRALGGLPDAEEELELPLRGRLFLRRPLRLAVGKIFPVDSGRRWVDRIMVTVHTGVIDVWFGEVEAGAGAPDLRFVSGLGTQEVWLAPAPVIMTLYNPLTLQQSEGTLLLFGG